VRIGVAGLGFMGKTHLEAIASMAGVEVAAVAARNEKALSGDLSQAGGNLGRGGATLDFSNARKFTDWRSMILESDVDAVDICLPTEFHCEATLLALDRGKHVLVEKPMALTAGECAQMIAAAKRAGKTLMVAHVLRFWPEYLELRRFAGNAELGVVKRARFERRCALPDWSPWLADEKRSGGAVLDLLIHDVDQALACFGLPETVECHGLGPVDTMDAALHYANGMDVELRGGWYPSGTPFFMGFEIERARSAMKLEEGRLQVRERVGTGQDAYGTWEPAPVSEGDGYRNEISYFIQCCREGTAPQRCLPEDSALAVRLTRLLKQARLEGGKRLPCSI
jgi:predicted dehydrogenase